jgi:hypothetical protein
MLAARDHLQDRGCYSAINRGIVFTDLMRVFGRINFRGRTFERRKSNVNKKLKTFLLLVCMGVAIGIIIPASTALPLASILLLRLTT